MDDANLNECNDHFDETLEEVKTESAKCLSFYFKLITEAQKVGIEQWQFSLHLLDNTMRVLKADARGDQNGDYIERFFINVAIGALFTYVCTTGWSNDSAAFLKNVFPLLDEMKRIHAIKGHDYGDRERPYQNCRISEEMGIPAWKGVLIRLSDKVERLCAFARQRELKVKDESIKDTCIDAANYAIIGLILYRETLPYPFDGEELLRAGKEMTDAIDATEHLFTHLNVGGKAVSALKHEN